MLEDFQGKKVLVTGAAGVFGKWIAEAFAREGAKVCLSDIRGEKLTEISHSPSFQGVETLTHATDLRDHDSINSLVELIENEWGYVDYVINNAGLYPNHLLLDMSFEDWKKVLDVNLNAVFLLTQKLAKLMVENNVKGSIVNVTSGAAYTVRMGSGHYSTSKAGLAMLTRGFAIELAQYGIRVNSVGPGFAPGSDNDANHLDGSYVETVVKGIPLGRTSQQNDTPEAILFLCSERASFITGAYLPVDGGKSAGNFTAPRSSTKEVTK
jgi:3-oxoacyl-[acyl-carrier protein] reductase